MARVNRSVFVVFLVTWGCSSRQAVDRDICAGHPALLDGGAAPTDGPTAPDARPQDDAGWTIQPDATTPDAAVADLWVPWRPPVPDASADGPVPPPPANGTCINAQTVPLVGGKAKVKGDTTFSKNEYGTAINCGLPFGYPVGAQPMAGPQLYYRFPLQAGKSYKVALVPDKTPQLVLYLFKACGAAQINADCGSNGTSGGMPYLPGPKGARRLVFTPTSSGDYYVAVDSPNAKLMGSFVLTVETFTPATNGTCPKAQPLTLKNGHVSVAGDTTGVPNDGLPVGCGFPPGHPLVFLGSQVYYSVKLTQGKSYKVAVGIVDHPMAFYVFGDSCDPKQIDADCSSKGKSGIVATTALGTMTGFYAPTALFAPPATGVYRIAVEAWPYASGAFQLEIDEHDLPPNGTCAAAQQVTLASGTTVIKGDTTGVPNEFGTAVNCATYGSNGSQSYFRGSQLYYQASLTAGTTYTFTLTPGAGFKKAVLYLFGGGCSWPQINADCGSKGATGDVLHASEGAPTSMSFTPAKSGKVRFAVDSDYAVHHVGYYGPFEVTIQ